MQRKVTIDVAVHGGTVPVLAREKYGQWAIHRPIPPDGGETAAQKRRRLTSWRVTHVPTGKIVFACDKLDKARAFATPLEDFHLNELDDREGYEYLRRHVAQHALRNAKAKAQP